MYISVVLLAFILAFVIIPRSLSAETVIKNSVSATADSGGNTAEGGEVITGTSSAEVHIESEVNGETEVIHKETRGTGSASARAEQTITATGGGVHTTSSAEVETGPSATDTTEDFSEALRGDQNGSPIKPIKEERESSTTPSSTVQAAADQGTSTPAESTEGTKRGFLATFFGHIFSYVSLLFN